MAIAPKYGFPEFGSGEPEILIQTKLTSAALMTASGGVAYGAGAGSIDYNETGVLLNATAGLKWTGLSAAQKAQLATGGTLTCWIESGYIDYTRVPATHEYCIGMHNSVLNCVSRYQGQNYLIPFMNNTIPVAQQTPWLTTAGKGQHTRIDLSGIGNDARLYVDHLLSSETQPWPKLSADFNNITLGGSSSAPSGPVSHHILAMMVSTKPIVLPVQEKTRHIAWFGHSYVQQADYAPSHFYVIQEALGGGAHQGDSQGVPAMQRELAKRGIGVGRGRIRNYGYGGKVLYDATGGLAWQLAAAKLHNGTFGTLVMMWGANEISNAGNNTWASQYGPGGAIQADWRQVYLTQIDAAIALGASRILIFNTVSTKNNPALNSAQNLANVDACNVDIDWVISQRPTVCKKIDAFANFGGHSTPASYWGGTTGVDAAHPSLTMNGNMGIWAANALLAMP